MDLTGQTAFVAGGASGIGAAVTRVFAAAGARVAFTWMTSGTEAAALERDLDAAGGRVLAIRADLTREGDCEAAFADAEAAFGPPDVLFANAGGLIGRARCTEATLDLWTEAIAVNLTATFLTCRSALRRMEPRGSGCIITMSSLAAFDGGGPGAAHYAAAKGAVVTFTRALAKEAGPLGIRVNGVAPGLIGTRFHDTFNTPEGRRATAERTLLRREGTPEDVAKVVLFLASNGAGFLAGETVQVNGGLGLY